MSLFLFGGSLRANVAANEWQQTLRQDQEPTQSNGVRPDITVMVDWALKINYLSLAIEWSAPAPFTEWGWRPFFWQQIVAAAEDWGKKIKNEMREEPGDAAETLSKPAGASAGSKQRAGMTTGLPPCLYRCSSEVRLFAYIYKCLPICAGPPWIRPALI